MSLTLNQIVENTAYKLGDQFNHTLQESLKQTYIHYRAKYIRDTLEKDFFNYGHFTQTITLKLKEVYVIEEFNASLCKTGIFLKDEKSKKYKVLRTENTIPTSVRLRNWGRSSFRYVGSTNFTKPFTITTFDEVEFKRCLPYQNKNINYVIANNYLYILDTLDICDVLIDGIFEDPRIAFKKCSVKSGFADDNIFPIGVDMLMSIEKNILRGEYPIIKDGEEINIKKDDRE